MKLAPHEEEDEIMMMRKDEMMIRNMMQMKQAGFEATMRDDTSAGIHFDYKEAPPAPTPPPDAAPAQGGAPVQTSDWVMPPTMSDILKRTVMDSNRNDGAPVPESVRTTMGTQLPPMRRLGLNSQIALKRRGAGQSPDHVKRHSGMPKQAGSLGDMRDFRSPEEVNADRKIKDLDDRLGID